MKILLTGANGNFGTIFKQVCSEHQVIAISRAEWGNIENLCNGSIDLILHAAYDLKTDVTINPSKIIHSNISTTSSLLEMAAKNKIKRFAFISSCAVYGDTSYAEEGHSCAPQTINGITKQLNEELILNFCKKNELNYHIFRLFNLYGGDDHFSIISKIIKCYKEKTPFVLNNDGISQRDFIEVHDAATVIRKILDVKADSFIMNIGTGQSTKIIDIVRTFENKFGTLSKIRTERREIEYSRANTTQLNKIVDYNFRDIISYINQMKNIEE